jgi:predicted glycoside hydrolase/deacetylase ChbG (UPF0249 family)
MIRVIVTADDFGYSQIFNSKILELLDKGLVLSTSVMVNRVSQAQSEQISALKVLRKSKRIDVGLHAELDFTKKIQFRNDIRGQLEKFTLMFGFEPTHLNLHKVLPIRSGGVARNEVISAITELSELAKKANVPIRNLGVNPLELRTTNKVSFYNPRIGFDGLVEYIKNTNDGDSCELITHPGEYDPKSTSTLNRERKTEYGWIIRLGKFFEANRNMKLSSFIDIV